MKKIFATGMLLVAATVNTGAAELFKDGKPTEFVKDSALEPGSTLGGYPIYTGDGGWRITNLKSSLSGANGNATAINQGTSTFVQLEPNGDWFATLWTTVNLTSAGGNQYMTGSPCAGQHIVAVNSITGRDDNCLTRL